MLTSPTVEVVGWALLHFLWQGTLLAVALAGTLQALENHAPTVRYGTAVVTLVAFLVLPLATALVLSGGEPSLSLGGETELGPAVDRAGASPEVVASTGQAGLARHLRPVLPWIVLGWGLGVLASAGRFWIGVWQSRRLRQAGTPAPDRWQRRLTALARRLGVKCTVALRRSDRVTVPAVAGWWRPVLLVPAGFLGGLPPKQVEAVLLHELAHVRRHDVLVARLQAVCETLLFFHPATWWVSRRIRRAREACCDAAVVEAGPERSEYARALASLAEQVYERSRPAGRLGVGDGRLLRRIRHVLNPAEPPSIRKRWGAQIMAALLLLGGPVGLVHLASQQAIPEPAALVASWDKGASFVLTEDATGHVALHSVEGADASRATGQAGRSREWKARLDSARLHQSIRANVDLDRLNRHLPSSLDPALLQRALRVRPDSLAHLAGGTLNPDRLRRAVQREVADSLGRTLRAHLDVDRLDRPVKIRVDLDEPKKTERQARESYTRPDAPPVSREELASRRPLAADSILSQAVTKSLRDTTIILGRTATVIRSGDTEVVLDAVSHSS